MGNGTRLTNDEALDQLREADVTLSKALGEAKTPQAKQKILDAMHVIMREYGLLLGVDVKGDPYKVLTAQFKGAASQIKGLIKTRNTLVTDINTATQIAQSLTPLLAMI